MFIFEEVHIHSRLKCIYMQEWLKNLTVLEEVTIDAMKKSRKPAPRKTILGKLPLVAVALTLQRF